MSGDGNPPEAMLNPPFTLAELTHWIGSVELAKGRGYLDAFKDFTVNQGSVKGRVKGSGKRWYDVYAECHRTPKGPKFFGDCTCPVGYRCKHVAAAFLYWLQSAEKSSERENTAEPSRAILAWLETLSQQTIASPPTPKKAAKPAPIQRLLYCIHPRNNGLGVSIWKGRQSAEGLWQGVETWSNIERALKSPPKFVASEDLPILLTLHQHGALSTLHWHEGFIQGEAAARMLEQAAATGRLLMHDGGDGRYSPKIPAGRGCQLGTRRPARLVWETSGTSALKPFLHFDPEARVLLVAPLWYADPASGEIGPGQLENARGEQGHSPWLVTLLQAPPLSPKDASLVAEVLRESGLAPYAPPADAESRVSIVDVSPAPLLQLTTVRHRRWISSPPYFLDYLDYATVRFVYGDQVLDPGQHDHFKTDVDGTIRHVKRHLEDEKVALQTLHKLGFRPIQEVPLTADAAQHQTLMGLQTDSEWLAFMTERAPRLRLEGWHIEYDGNFRHAICEIENWHGSLEEGEEGWFNLAMGIEVNGKRLSLQPLLRDLFGRDSRWLAPAGLDNIPDRERIILFSPEVGRIAVAAKRLKAIVRTLIDLFDDSSQDHFKVSRWDAARLEELANLADKNRWQFKGAEAVQQLAQRLSRQQLVPVEPTDSFRGQLRPYQRDGLSWLQYLRAQDLSGVLADDMGLGKTPQTIAHLLFEKEAGRLDVPALVIMPTSVLHNWHAELARFAPSLKVLALHGQSRKEAFAQIPDHDVVLTTYPLLWRDADQLGKYAYHLLILDEAQSVKNAATKSAATIRTLKARHRLALTGTPLENHLGELWTLFDFLLPGFLRDLKDFTRRWRTPIEKYGDRLRADLLSRRIRSFILRRRKEDVAKELPPKTVIVRSVELEAAQRDLYETVRVAMDEKVRQEIASKGFKRSQITILDALLKLRQVCCDPGLVKLPAANRVKHSAKLELLFEMLPELIAEDRKILLFSQFTSMLDIIEARLDKLKIGYLKLTGDTRDRATPVRQFQSGKVPLFLISLRAGGVGLNLTAADTVIHYDPWWNPAVENQATDRAHRIGQEKKVFVYKLVVAGSIEEKIMELQEKKSALAAGILSEDGGELAKFSESDIAALLAPLPD